MKLFRRFKFNLFRCKSSCLKFFDNSFSFRNSKIFEFYPSTNEGNSQGFRKCLSKSWNKGKGSKLARGKSYIKSASYSFFFICHILITTPSFGSEQLENIQTFEDGGILYENTLIPPDVYSAMQRWKGKDALYCIAAHTGDKTIVKCFTMRAK